MYTYSTNMPFVGNHHTTSTNISPLLLREKKKNLGQAGSWLPPCLLFAYLFSQTTRHGGRWAEQGRTVALLRGLIPAHDSPPFHLPGTTFFPAHLPHTFPPPHTTTTTHTHTHHTFGPLHTTPGQCPIYYLPYTHTHTPPHTGPLPALQNCPSHLPPPPTCPFQCPIAPPHTPLFLHTHVFPALPYPSYLQIDTGCLQNHSASLLCVRLLQHVCCRLPAWTIGTLKAKQHPTKGIEGRMNGAELFCCPLCVPFISGWTSSDMFVHNHFVLYLIQVIVLCGRTHTRRPLPCSYTPKPEPFWYDLSLSSKSSTLG